MIYKTKWTEEDVQKLKELYPVTKDWKILLKAFPFSNKRSIIYEASKFNLHKPRGHKGYLHKLNHNLFDEWNEKSAYILGYLEADGYIQKYNGFTFATSEKDLKYLQLLHKTVESTHKICNRNHYIKNETYTTCAFSVSSEKWAEKIKPLLRKKKIPEEIPNNLIHHYIRGYFDGDGSIYFDQQTKNYKSSFVFSSELLAIDFRKKIKKQNILVSNIHKKINAECWYFRLGYHQTKKIGEFMYQDSNLYMNRKYELFQSQKKLYDR